MSSSYEHYLPNVFPGGVYIVTDVLAKSWASFLLLEHPNSPSSFAMTADARPGYVKLWLSKVSYERSIPIIVGSGLGLRPDE